MRNGRVARDQRRARARERMEAHVYNPKTCKPNCPKRPKRRSDRETFESLDG